MRRSEIFAAIIDERRRQQAKWNRRHDHGYGDCSSLQVPDAVKVAVLTEEVGEVARAFLDGDTDNLVVELVQVAAVAVAWLEALPAPEKFEMIA